MAVRIVDEKPVWAIDFLLMSFPGNNYNLSVTELIIFFSRRSVERNVCFLLASTIAVDEIPYIYDFYSRYILDDDSRWLR